MASFHHRVKSGKKGSAAEHAAYITRLGKFSEREDLVACGYGNMPSWAIDGPSKFWRAGDRFERANGAVYREHEIALPEELTRKQQQELVDGLVEMIAGEKPYQFAVHSNISSIEGVRNTHLHLMYSDRMPDGIERAPEQTFSRFNAVRPELGGRRKESGGRNQLEMRMELIETRKRCAELQNATLEKYGHAERVDHRTLKQQGIERQPEKHLGQVKIKLMTPLEKRDYANRRLATPFAMVDQAPATRS
jgi:hypothetical protein